MFGTGRDGWVEVGAWGSPTRGSFRDRYYRDYYPSYSRYSRSYSRGGSATGSGSGSSAAYGYSQSGSGTPPSPSGSYYGRDERRRGGRRNRHGSKRHVSDSGSSSAGSDRKDKENDGRKRGRGSGKRRSRGSGSASGAGDDGASSEAGSSRRPSTPRRPLTPNRGSQQLQMANSTFLVRPITDKNTERGSNRRFRYGFADMQGWRASMEDAHNIELDFDGDTALFAVYDGHGGTEVSKLCAEEIPQRIKDSSFWAERNIPDSLTDAFMSLDRDLVADKYGYGAGPGTTAVVAVVTRETVFVANVGDSRAVLGKGGKTVPLTEDHKPSLPEERKRILNAGFYTIEDRVNGQLAMSRSIGDIEYKLTDRPLHEQPVIALPEIRKKTITPEVEFMVVACDGIWEVLSNQEVVDFVRKKRRKTRNLTKICESILDAIIAEPSDTTGNGRDNCTIMIIEFLAPESDNGGYYSGSGSASY